MRVGVSVLGLALVEGLLFRASGLEAKANRGRKSPLEQLRRDFLGADLNPYLEDHGT